MNKLQISKVKYDNILKKTNFNWLWDIERRI